MLAIILNAIVIVGLIYKSQKSFLKLGWDVIAMLTVFIVGGYLVFLFL